MSTAIGLRARWALSWLLGRDNGWRCFVCVLVFVVGTRFVFVHVGEVAGLRVEIADVEFVTDRVGNLRILGHHDQVATGANPVHQVRGARGRHVVAAVAIEDQHAAGRRRIEDAGVAFARDRPTHAPEESLQRQMRIAPGFRFLVLSFLERHAFEIGDEPGTAEYEDADDDHRQPDDAPGHVLASALSGRLPKCSFQAAHRFSIAAVAGGMWA